MDSAHRPLRLVPTGDEEAIRSLTPAVIAAEFAAEFRRVHLEAGKPSYRVIERRSRKLVSGDLPISPSTISRAFSGLALPKWGVVQAILLGCETSPEARAHVRTLWTEAAARIEHVEAAEHRRLENASPDRPAGSECPSCGSWVVNTAQHGRWHATLDGNQPSQPGQPGA
jgi:hypothetical protein